MTTSAVRAPASGRPFENLLTGVLMASGFVVDVDVLWNVVGDGDVAQFDGVASALTGKKVHRIIVECKGGDKWGFSDAFQLLGEVRAVGESLGLLLAVERRSLERGSRSATALDRLFSGHGVHVIGIPIDDRVAEQPTVELHKVQRELFDRGLIPVLSTTPETGDIEIYARGIARLRGAFDRVSLALSHPMSAANTAAAALMAVIRSWDAVALEPAERLTILRSAIVPTVGSQKGWADEAKAADEHFGRDVAVVEAYAGAQEVAALTQALRRGWTMPPTANVSRNLRRSLLNLDLHGATHAAYVLALSTTILPLLS